MAVTHRTHTTRTGAQFDRFTFFQRGCGTITIAAQDDGTGGGTGDGTGDGTGTGPCPEGQTLLGGRCVPVDPNPTPGSGSSLLTVLRENALLAGGVGLGFLFLLVFL